MSLHPLPYVVHYVLTNPPRRQKYGMKRGVDGRVQLRHSKEGIWYELKLDNEVKGTLLLRNSKNGNVHVLQTDKLEQASGCRLGLQLVYQRFDAYVLLGGADEQRSAS